MSDQQYSLWYYSMVQVVLRYLGLDFKAQATSEIARRDAALGREIAGRFSRGNLSIQRGRFLTVKDLDRQRKHIEKIQF
jgi:hypothetical protein